MKILNKKMVAMLLSVAMILNMATPTFAQTTESLSPHSPTVGESSSQNGDGSSDGANSSPNSDGSFDGTNSSPNSAGSSDGTNSSPNSDGSFDGTNSSPNSDGSFDGTNSSPNSDGSSDGANSSPNSDGSSDGANSSPNSDGSSQGNNTVGAEIAITAFVPLSTDIEKQTVAVGTLQEKLVLPTELKAITMGENSQPQEVELLGVKWELSVKYNGEALAYNPDVEGSYVFTPIIPSGYTLAEGVVLPQIIVMVGAQNSVNALVNNSITESGITIAATEGGRVEYTNGGFKLNTNGSYHVSGTWNGIITDDSGVRKSVIEVAENIIANITIGNTTIELNDGNVGWSTENISSALGTTPLEVGDGATANVTVTGIATLKGGSGAAGINVHETGTLNITKESTGTLKVVGGKAAAGIGGDCVSNGGTINIAGGTINATGVQNGAAIGGGHANDSTNGTSERKYGNFAAINITGGTVTAIAESDGVGNDGNAAAIGSGCWAVGDCGAIKIDGATVYAKTTSNHNATANAIGRGIHDANDKNNIAVTINNSYVEAKTVRSGAECMPGATITNSIVFENSSTVAVINTDCTISNPITIPSGMSVEVEQGKTLTLTGKVTNNGTITVNGTLNVNSGVTNNGTINVNGTLNVNSGVTNDGTITVNGTLNVNSTIINNGVVACAKGTIINEGNITGNGVFNGTEFGGIMFSGGVAGTDYILDSNANTITVKGSAELTFAGIAEKLLKIIVADGVNANITFNSLNIINNDGGDVGWGTNPNMAGTAAVDLIGKATLNLTLAGISALQSGEGMAGIHVPTDATLNITTASTGTLNVAGGNAAAGIGGDLFSNGGTINIAGGTINATGIKNGAAIGGGHANDNTDGSSVRKYGNFKAINITGGTVTAIAESDSSGNNGNAAAIGSGCWAVGNGGTINIDGATVYAKTTSNHNATANAIGRGIHDESNKNNIAVTINNSYVEAKTVANGAECIPGATITNSIVFQNSSTLCVGSCTIEQNLSIPQDMVLTVSNGTSLTVNGEFTNRGEIWILDGGTLQINGSAQNKGVVCVHGTLNVGSNWVNSGVDYNYIINTLTILTGKAMTISGTTTKDKIVVADGVTADITLKDVSIQPQNGSGIALAGAAKLNLTLTGNNTIKSKDDGGIYVPSAATFTITAMSTGNLQVTGGTASAGIGGNGSSSAGIINILGGTVDAHGSGDGAAIGGGHANDENRSYGGFKEININNAVVKANMPDKSNAAAIGTGCWSKDGNGRITIKNDSYVWAQAYSGKGTECAAIGRGVTEDGVNRAISVTIDGSVVIASNQNGECAPATVTNGLLYKNNQLANDFSGSLTSTRSFTIGGSKELIIPENSSITLSGNVASTGVIRVGGTLTIGKVGTFENYGTIKAQGTLTNNGTFNNVKSGRVRDENTGTVTGIDNYIKGAIVGDLIITSGIRGTDFTVAESYHNFEEVGVRFDGINSIITILTSKPLEISGRTEGAQIVIKDGVTANVTLAGAVIDARKKIGYDGNRCALELMGNATLNLTLKDNTENECLSGPLNAGICVPENATLVINGNGAVMATSASNGSGIGNATKYDDIANAGSITINGGRVTAYGLYGIGGGLAAGSTGGTFKANNSAIIIANSIQDQRYIDEWNCITITDGNNGEKIGKVYGNNVIINRDLEIPLNTTLNIKSGETLTVGASGTVTNKGDVNVDGTLALTAGGSWKNVDYGVVNKSGSGIVTQGIEFNDTSSETMKFQDITITSQSGAYNKLYTCLGGTITFIADGTATLSGTADNTNKIVVKQGVKANITLNGLNITLDNGIPFDMTGAQVNLTLGGNSENTLLAKAVNTPALCVNDESAKLTITGSGNLSATSKGDCTAAIGSSTYIQCGTITINSGHITASCFSPSNFNPAAIGGGTHISTEIVINGGVVKTHGPIGGGEGVSTGSITINGGYVQSDWGIGKNGNGNIPLKITGGAVVVCQNISDNKTDVNNWNGLVFGNNNKVGTLYGDSVAIAESFTMEKTMALTIDSGKDIIVPNGVIFTNNGIITNNGKITVQSGGTLINNGTIINNGEITVVDGGTINNAGGIENGTDGTVSGTVSGNPVKEQSAIDLTVELTSNPGTTVTTAKYGDTITIKATITEAAKAGRSGSRSAAFNKVDFYQERNGKNPTLIATVDLAQGEQTASTQVLLQAKVHGASWLISDYTIKAEFGGATGLLPSVTKVGQNLTVTMGDTATVSDPVVKEVTQNSITLYDAHHGAVGEYPFRIDYGIKKDGTSDITWQDNSTTFTSLTPNTKYMIYTKFIGAGFYNDVMSNGVEVTTEKSSISGTAAFDNAAPCYGDTITLTPRVDTQNCGELSYKWYRDNTEIAGETGTKYTVAKEDVGTVITVKVTAKSCTGELSCATPKIALRTITSLATANGKIYNGNTNATVHFTFKNVVNNDNVTATANATFNTKTAGNNKEVTLSSFALGQPWQDFYTCAVPKNPTADITPKTITGVTVGKISDVTYTGQWQTPSVTLTDGDLNETLEKDVDYTLDYANNKDVGTAKVTIKAKGNYNSNVEASFEIVKATPTIIVTAEKKETFMGRIFASHNDTLMVTAQVKGTQNGSAPSGTVAFSVKNGNGSYTPIAGGEKIGVAGGKAVLEFKNPPVGALVFKAEFTSQVASNYTNGEGTSLSYSIDKGEQDALNIKGVPTTVTYGDESFTLTANGGSGIGRVSYHVTSGSDVASVDETSGEVKILKSGTAIITATKAGDDSFNATMVQTELVVEQAQPRLAFSQDTQTVVYAGSPAQLQAPIVTLTGGDSYSEAENGAILYQYKKGIMSSWEVGLPTQAGEYTICARLEPKGNYKLCTSQNITLTIEKAAAEPTVIPTGLQAITNTQKTLAAVTLPQDAKGIWSWKNEKTSLVADSDNKVQNFKAIFTPLDKDNYSATEKDIPLKVSKIVATFEKLDLVEITKENGSEEISADITIIGAEMPTEGAMVIEEVVTWSNSAPNIVKLVENNQGMSYKSTVTGLAKGISMVGIEVNGKPAGSVLVKYAPKAEEESNNGAGDIDSAADVVESILEGAEGLTEPEKAVVKSLGDELLKLPPEEKEKLAISTIENLDALVEKAQGIATQSTAEVEQNVENPIDTTKVQVKGMALASGSTAADSVEVKIKQQAPTKNQEGKQATLEFSMEMTVNGKPQQLKSPLLITLPLPKGVDTKDMVIRHTKQDGTAEDITYAATLSSGHYTIKGDSITMWANSFSTFTFMIAKNAVVPVAPVAPTTSEDTTDHENEFWIGVVSKIQGAKKGDVIKINTGDYDKMPATVMEGLRLKGIGMVITCGAKTVTIPAGRAKNAEKDREVWTINQLLELYKNYTFVDNSGKTSPSTGGYGYLDATTGETQPITGAVVETPELKDKTSHIGAAHTEKQSTATWIFVPIVGILLVAGGYATALYRRKKPQEERGEDR